MEEIKTIQFAGKVATKVFAFRALDANLENYEIEYIAELIGVLKRGMTVYDIGAENGELTAMVANIVGGENVHIFEPNTDYFPNIKATWEANELNNPANCFNGYVYEKSSSDVIYTKLFDGNIFHGCEHVNPLARPMQTVSLDDYCKIFNPPDVVMMDIEGAELSAIRGAENLLKNHAPIFFISIHKPYFILDRSNGTKEDLIKTFTDNGYEATHISTDHEEHWKFIKT